MPKTEHFQTTADWDAVRALWLQWKNGLRPDLKNQEDVAREAGVPYSTLTKKTPRWKKDIQADLEKKRKELEAQEKAIGGPKVGATRTPTGKEDSDRLSADSPSSSGNSNQYVDEYRSARLRAKEALDVAVQGLIEEIQQGSGASRVTAIRELLDRAGLSKETEKKDEASPYETENEEGLFSRMVEVFQVYPGWRQFIEYAYNNLLPLPEDPPGKSISDPTTLSGSPHHDLITPVPSPAQNTSGKPVEGGIKTVLPKSSLPPLPPTPGCIEMGQVKEVDGIKINHPLG